MKKTATLEASLRDAYRLTQENQLRIAEISKHGFGCIKTHQAQVEKERKDKLTIIMENYDRAYEMDARKIYGGDYDLIKKKKKQ